MRDDTHEGTGAEVSAEALSGAGAQSDAEAPGGGPPTGDQPGEVPPDPGAQAIWSADDLSDVWTRAIAYGADAVLLATAGVILSLYLLCLTPIWMLTRFPYFVAASFALLLGIYCTFLVGGSANTLGHRMLRLTVVRTDGSRVSYGRAFVRWLGYLLCTLTIFVGFAIAAWDRNCQGLHDKLADTVVLGPRAALSTKIWASALLLALVVAGLYGIAWLY